MLSKIRNLMEDGSTVYFHSSEIFDVFELLSNIYTSFTPHQYNWNELYTFEDLPALEAVVVRINNK